jgi:PAS domain S-box-containing protein
MNRKAKPQAAAARLRQRAEASLRALRRAGGPAAAAHLPAEADTRRALQELQVHQVELEMQNAELREARDQMEALLGKYSDLYEFAPVGYFTLDEAGRITEVNLTGATVLGVERALLINRRLLRFVVPANRPEYLALLERILAGNGKHAHEIKLLHASGATLWADIHGKVAVAPDGSRKMCQLAVMDISALKRAAEAQRRLEALDVANQELQNEIVQRRQAEATLRESEQELSRLLEQSQRMRDQLRQLSHKILHVQEEEQKRISRELHDEVAQTLVAINLALSMLGRESTISPSQLKRHIARTQRQVEKSLLTVHRFARQLRPPALDDLGLVAALKYFVSAFMAQTGINVHLTVFAGVEKLGDPNKTALYRVAREALTNAHHHAGASRVVLSIRRLRDCVCMKITDNGKGFQIEHEARQQRANQRLGLLGMTERMEMVGGSLSIESTPGKGTTIRAKIPLRRKPARAPGKTT